jgi:nucleoside-diphosphate-sugar epimerase
MTGRVLVTGGGGFIGGWVVRELLERELKPVVLDARPVDERWKRVVGKGADTVRVVTGSLLDRKLLSRLSEEWQIWRIIHLAALLTPDCQRDPFQGCEVNVLGSVAIFELARSSGGRIGGVSYASSYAVYGPEPDEAARAPAAHDERPPMFYGVFKLAVDQIADQYWRHFGVPSVGIRPHVVYGPERTVGLTAGPSLAAKAAVRGEPFVIPYSGRVGYDYVGDVAAAFVRSALDPSPGSFVFDLPSQRASPQDFIAAIDRVVPGSGKTLSAEGPHIPSNVPRQPNGIHRLFPDWRPTTIDEGIRKTVEFYCRTPVSD